MAGMPIGRTNSVQGSGSVIHLSSSERASVNKSNQHADGRRFGAIVKAQVGRSLTGSPPNGQPPPDQPTIREQADTNTANLSAQLTYIAREAHAKNDKATINAPPPSGIDRFDPDLSHDIKGALIDAGNAVAQALAYTVHGIEWVIAPAADAAQKIVPLDKLFPSTQPLSPGK